MKLIPKLRNRAIWGLNSSQVENKSSPNQGIWRSATNSLLIVLIVGLLFGLFVGLNSRLLLDLDKSLQLFETLSLLGTSVSFGLFFGLFFGLSFGGGNACIQHFALRLVLWRSGSIPWNYARFLNYCTERLLLQRVGGRYRFVHKLLQERFAELGNR